MGREPPGVSIVVPLLNEKEVVHDLVERLTTVREGLPSSELIFVDDGSTDGTFDLLVELTRGRPGVSVVRLTRNFGQHAAITAGLAESSGECVVLMDGDLQDPPEEIPRILATRDETGADVVYGLRAQREDHLWRKITSGLFKRALSRALPRDLPPNIGTFRVLSRRVVDAFLALPERGRYVTGLIDWLGYPHAFHPYQRAGRGAGRTSYGFRGLVKLALKGMTAFSIWPIQLCAAVGSLLAAGSFLAGLVFLVKKIFFGSAVTGFTALIVSITFIGGVQLLFLGLVGLYVARIFEEVKARPIYVVEKKVESGGDDGAS